MDAFRIAFEHVGDTDSVDFAFEYSILAKKAGDSDYTKIADHQRGQTVQIIMRRFISLMPRSIQK